MQWSQNINLNIKNLLIDYQVFEKAGVGVSVVHGMIPPAAVAQMNAR